LILLISSLFVVSSRKATVRLATCPAQLRSFPCGSVRDIEHSAMGKKHAVGLSVYSSWTTGHGRESRNRIISFYPAESGSGSASVRTVS
jgi:hypothetical protein